MYDHNHITFTLEIEFYLQDLAEIIFSHQDFILEKIILISE